jgi:uncharacterized membrane protein
LTPLLTRNGTVSSADSAFGKHSNSNTAAFFSLFLLYFYEVNYQRQHVLPLVAILLCKEMVSLCFRADLFTLSAVQSAALPTTCTSITLVLSTRVN